MARARRPLNRRRRNVTPAHVRAFSVHIFTALGAGCALLALVAAARADWVTMFAWLGAALVIDGIDGTLARAFRVAATLPRWSGDSLDFVVDFTTYVLVPAFALAVGNVLPPAAAVPLAVAVVMSGAIYFADTEMKMAGNYFRGFPVLWNGVAFHLFVLKLPPWVAAAIVAAFVVLTFVPFRSIHPLRVERFRWLNLAVLAAWSLLALYALLWALNPEAWLAWAGALCAVYLVGAGLFSARK